MKLVDKIVILSLAVLLILSIIGILLQFPNFLGLVIVLIWPTFVIWPDNLFLWLIFFGWIAIAIFGVVNGFPNSWGVYLVISWVLWIFSVWTFDYTGYLSKNNKIIYAITSCVSFETIFVAFQRMAKILDISISIPIFYAQKLYKKIRETFLSFTENLKNNKSKISKQDTSKKSSEFSQSTIELLVFNLLKSQGKMSLSEISSSLDIDAENLKIILESMAQESLVSVEESAEKETAYLVD
ncbi:hypothetical protein [Synechococcus elongatus]|nr:hypothetical protein [Synechococcus elongatus]